MKIIFLRDVGGAGRAGEIKEVSDGYALNFLIPHRLAEQATKERVAAHEKHMAEGEAQKKEKEAELKRIIQSLNGAQIEIQARATEKGGLFKAIGAKEIVSALADQKNAKLSEEVIRLSAPIKTTGEHPIILKVDVTEVPMTLLVVQMNT